MAGRTARRRVTRVTVDPGGVSERADLLAAEEPLGIRIGGQAVSLTMRTPGDDIDLAAGFLVSEGIVASAADIASITICDGQRVVVSTVVTTTGATTTRTTTRSAISPMSRCDRA